MNLENISIFSIISIFTVIATARYETAIMLPRSETSTQSIVFLCAIICTLLFFLTLILMSVFYKPLIASSGTNLVWLLPFFFNFGILVKKMMHNRQKKYQLLSVNRVEQSIISASGQLLFGLFSFGSMGLVISDDRTAHCICQATSKARFRCNICF